MTAFETLLNRAEAILSRLEAVLPAAQESTNWDAVAWRWVRSQPAGHLAVLTQLDPIQLSDLHGIEVQKAALLQNTQQFVAGFPANHVLLAGARGTGKSSLVKAVFNALSDQGLRLMFHPCDQDNYLAIAAQWLKFYGLEDFDKAASAAALQWSYTRGARSGRTANQFAKDYVGRLKWAQQQAASQ